MTIPCPPEFELWSPHFVETIDITCEVTDVNTFVINAPFREAYSYMEGEHGYLLVVFEGATNPLSARDIITLKIETRMADGEAVDRYISDSTQMTIVPSPFFA
jgi:hypothetical protein